MQTLGPVDPATAKLTRVKAFDQEGEIWQAEEALVEGVWRRYYGFVGRHVVAGVPAEEGGRRMKRMLLSGFRPVGTDVLRRHPQAALDGLDDGRA